MPQVSVYHLIAKGTIEEMVYLRQLYKQQLSSSILDGHSDESMADRQFEGAMGSGKVIFRGELFGCENLFQYSSSSILQRVRRKYEALSGGGAVDQRTKSVHGVDTSNLLSVDRLANYLTTSLEEHASQLDKGVDDDDVDVFSLLGIHPDVCTDTVPI